MKLLITGGLGGIAREGVNDYLSRYYDLVISHHREPEEKIKYEFMKVDITNQQQVESAVKNVDIIVHLAAKGAHSPLGNEEKDWRMDLSVNVTGTLNLLLAATKYRIKKFVYASSIWAYGLPMEGTFPDYLPIDEKHPLKVKHPYGLSKVLAEDLCKGYSRTHNLPIIVFRVGGVSTKKHHSTDEESLAWLRKNFPLGRDSYYNHIDVRDVAEAVRLAIESKITGYEVFNLFAEDHLWWVKDNSSLVKKYFPMVKKVKRNFLSGGNKSFFDISKIKKELGFKPRFPFKRYLDWMNSGRSDEKYYSLIE